MDSEFFKSGAWREKAPQEGKAAPQEAKPKRKPRKQPQPRKQPEPQQPEPEPRRPSYLDAYASLLIV